MKQPLGLLIAHRGYHDQFPENSLEAICAANIEGISGAEFDIRQTRDGFFLVHHDARLESDRPIHSLTLNEVREELGAPMVLLTDVLEKAPPSLYLYIEVKDRFADTGNLERILEEYAAFERSTILSFHPDILRALPTKVKRWLNVVFNLRFYATYVGHAIQPVALAKKLGVEAVGLHHSLVRSSGVDKAHQAGLKVIPWTVDNPLMAKKFQEFGVDGVISNIPLVISDHFQKLDRQKSQKVV